jgi:hypothetical protein
LRNHQADVLVGMKQRFVLAERPIIKA